jgi:hypothetical protein
MALVWVIYCINSITSLLGGGGRLTADALNGIVACAAFERAEFLALEEGIVVLVLRTGWSVQCSLAPARPCEKRPKCHSGESHGAGEAVVKVDRA